MMRSLCLGVLLAAGIGLFHLSVSASGSIGAGAGKVSPRAAYSQGKALTFDELVCDSCPVQKNELDRDRAQSLTASLVAVDAGTGSEADGELVAALCDGASAQSEDCNLRMELVHYFLTRRYKL